MTPAQNILQSLKSTILEIVPDARVNLFGSRARGDWNDESDWDILVLTNGPVNKSLKKKLHNKVFPLSVKAAAFINLLVIPEQDWLSSPSYYSLHQNISGEMVQI